MIIAENIEDKKTIDKDGELLSTVRDNFVKLPVEVLIMALHLCPEDFLNDVLMYRHSLLTGIEMPVRRQVESFGSIIEYLLREWIDPSQVALEPEKELEWIIRGTPMSGCFGPRRVTSMISMLGYDTDELIYYTMTGRGAPEKWGKKAAQI